jgi:hypothetical protein
MTSSTTAAWTPIPAIVWARRSCTSRGDAQSFLLEALDGVALAVLLGTRESAAGLVGPPAAAADRLSGEQRAGEHGGVGQRLGADDVGERGAVADALPADVEQELTRIAPRWRAGRVRADGHRPRARVVALGCRSLCAARVGAVQTNPRAATW